MKLAEEARIALDSVKASGSDRSVVELGWIDQIRVDPPKSIVRLSLPSFAQSQRDRLAKEITEILKGLEGIEEVQIEIGNPPSEQGAIGQAGHGQAGELPHAANARKYFLQTQF